MNYFLALYIVLSICYLGWGVASVTIANIQKRFAEQLTLAIALGTLLSTLALLLVHWGGTPITLQLVLILCTMSSLVLAATLFLQKKAVAPQCFVFFKQLRSWSTLEKAVLIIITALILGTVAQNLFWPVTDWDALALYDFRAKVVAETGSFAKGIELGYFFQYPPFTSLLHTVLYLAGVSYAKVWYSLIYTALITGVYSLLKKRTTRIIALSGALLIAINPLLFEHATMAYTNLGYTLFLALGTLYGFEWYRSHKSYAGVLAGIFIAGSTWVRSTEPFWVVGLLLICVVGIILTVQQKHWRSLAVAAFAVVVVFVLKQLWSTFTASLFLIDTQTATTLLSSSIKNTSSQSHYFEVFTSQSHDALAERFGIVFDYLRAYVFSIFLIYAMPLLILCTLSFKHLKKYWLEWGAVLAYITIIFLGTFLFSFSDSSWDQIGGSAQRMSMFLIPLCIFLLVGNNLWHNKRK